MDTASAIFVALNADQLNAGSAAPPTAVPNNTCRVTRQMVTVSTSGSGVPTYTLLSAGSLTLNGPNVVNAPLSVETLLNARVGGVTVVNGAVLAAGTYTITGAGGRDVGPFQASIPMSQPLSVTSTVPSSLQRSQDLTLAWAGGGTDPVVITGFSSVAAPGSTPGNPVLDLGIFTCVTTGDRQGFTVPTSVLQQLPAANGSITISSNNATINFTAPMVAGGNLDYGYFTTGFSNRFTVSYR